MPFLYLLPSLKIKKMFGTGTPNTPKNTPKPDEQKKGGVTKSIILTGLALAVLGGIGMIVLDEKHPSSLHRDMADEIAFPVLMIGIVITVIGILMNPAVWKNQHQRSIEELSNVHGTAKFAVDDDLEHLRSSQGLYIGGKDLSFKEQGHLLTVAGARSGKGVNLIIPNLLGASDYEGSWVVIDPKGENTAITAHYQQQSGRKVFILDPFRELKKQANLGGTFSSLEDLPYGQFNPLDVLDSNSEELTDDVEVIAEMIVPLSSGSDSHWEDRARSMIAGLLLHMMTSQEKENRSFFKLYEWLRLPQVDWMMLIQDMQRSEALYGVVRAQGNDLMSLMESGEKELSGILSTAKRCTDIFKSPGLIRSMAKSSFDVNQIAKQQMTLYLILPSDKLESHRTWLRLCIRMALTAVMRNKGHRVTFIMDEFHSLGHLKVIEKSMGRLPGYNVTLWPILQDLNQLKSLYKDSWETFVANSRVRHFFGIGDNFTAEYVSKKTGDTTVVTWNTSSGANNQTNYTYSTNKRALMTPNEVSSSPDIIMFVDNLPAAKMTKFPYYEWEEIKERAQSNPYYVS